MRTRAFVEYPMSKETGCTHSAFAIMHAAPILAAHPLAIAYTVTLSSVLPINAIVSARDFVALSRIVNSRSTSYTGTIFILCCSRHCCDGASRSIKPTLSENW